MKRVMFAAAVVLVSSLFFSSAIAQTGGGGSAGPGIGPIVTVVMPGDYTGETSQGLPMDLTVMQLPSGSMVIHRWSFNFELTCERSGRIVSIGMSFSGFDIPVDKKGRFNFQYNGSFMFIFSMNGHIIRSLAGGEVSVIWGAVDSRGHKARAELCMSNLPRDPEVWWLADHDDSVKSVPSSPGMAISNAHRVEPIAPKKTNITLSLVRDPRTGKVSESMFK